MIQRNQNIGSSLKKGTTYEKIVQKIRELYNGEINEPNAHEAARNLIGFCQVLLEMKSQQIQNLKKGVQE